MEVEIVSGSSVLSPSVMSSFAPQQIPSYWRAVEFLSGNLASFPVSIQQNGAATDEPHPLTKLFTRKANPYTTSKTLLKTWIYHGEHTGNGFIYVRRDPGTFEPIEFYTLLPEDVTPFRVLPDNGSIFDSQTFYWHGPSKRAFNYEDVLHYRPQISHDGLTGYSISQMFNPTFSRANLLEHYQAKFLRKGSMIRGSVEFPQGTTKEQAQEIMTQIRQFRASVGDNDIIGLFGGASLKNTTISPVDAQLMLQDAGISKKISQITGVPLVFLDTSESKYNAAAVEAAGQDVVRFAFRPRLENGIEPELSTKLLTEAEQDAGFSFHFDSGSLTRGDTAVETATAAQAVAAGLATRNEGRADIGLAPVEDPKADQLLVPTAVATESPSQAESETHSQDKPLDHYAALAPLIADAADRVERKTSKALENSQKKPEPERIAYSNALAEQQTKYAREALEPVAEALESLTGKKLDLDAIGTAYGAEIRHRAAGHEPRTLAAIIQEEHGTE